MSESPEEEQPSAFQPFTKAERIQQLNEIDKSILQLVQTAGQTLKILTASQASDQNMSPQERRQAFEAASNAYLRTLQSVDVRLRRQILGLEEADIIPADKIKTKAKGRPVGGPVAPGQPSGNKADEVTVDGGMGNLDIGWLNSRSGRVGRDMEAELWAKSRKFLEDLEKGIYNGQPIPQDRENGNKS
ncbi:mediator subunit Med11 protein [Rutstroemia sp. NJR-2017a WRK4]|nr:mediator subunit Med11 protein [Rutstroemia sp. NJR-2017a WRK4]